MRVFLDVFVTNERARHVYEKFGFRKEGIMRDAIYRDGAYYSLVLMSLLEASIETKHWRTKRLERAAGWLGWFLTAMAMLCWCGCGCAIRA